MNNNFIQKKSKTIFFYIYNIIDFIVVYTIIS